MEVKPLSNKIYSLLVLYEMQTDFFNRVLEAIPEEVAQDRLNTKANHIAWLAGSLVQQRFEIANELGITQQQQAVDLFEKNKGIQDGVTYPTLESFKKDWATISPLLKEKLLQVSDERLNQPFEMPGMEMSFFDLLSFVCYREANCIGQIALWRRLHGLSAMNYM